MKILWLALQLSSLSLCLSRRHSLNIAEPTLALPFNPEDEEKRSTDGGKLSDLLREFKFSEYPADVLRASIVHRLSPGWTKLDPLTGRKMEFSNVTNFLEKTRSASGTISCVWDQTLNDGQHTLRNKRVFIAANFKDNEAVLPHLILQLWHTIALLPENSVFMSIYESSSKDQTGFWLSKLEDLLKALHVPHRIKSDGAIAYVGHNFHQRIELLSRVRNAALEPLWSDDALWHVDFEEERGHYRRRNPRNKRRVAHLPPTHILFTNDVYACARDSIRLLYHEADAACGTDWWVNDGVLTFYDIWVARDISGARLQWHPPYLQDNLSQQRLKAGLPVPVKSCWNGLVVIRAAPFINEGLKFRTSHPDECFSSECKTICDDLIQLGFTNIVMDPGVRLTYLIQDAVDAFKPDRVKELPVTNWSTVRQYPLDAFDFSMSESSECCPLSSDLTWVEWPKCHFQSDIRRLQ